MQRSPDLASVQPVLTEDTGAAVRMTAPASTPASGRIDVLVASVGDQRCGFLARAMEQNLAVARQSEQTAQDLNSAAQRLKALVGSM